MIANQDTNQNNISENTMDNWNWGAFQAMIMKFVKHSIYPKVLPETITLDESFLNACMLIRNQLPKRYEVGSFLKINLNNSSIYPTNIQVGKKDYINLKGEPISEGSFTVGRIHRHPENSGNNIDDELDYYLGIGPMWFSISDSNKRGGDIAALLLYYNIFEIVIYKNFLSLAIKTEKTPKAFEMIEIENELFTFLNDSTNKGDIFTAYKEISRKYGLVFYITDSFEEKTLMKIK